MAQRYYQEAVVSEIDLLKGISEDNVSVRNMLSEPPPQVKPKPMPELPDLGLDKFRIHMSANGYDTFLTIIYWSVLCQQLSDGEKVDWDDGTFAAMSAGFVGFGNALHWDADYKASLGNIIHAHYLNWHGEGPKFRKNNPLPHKLIREVAPLFANTSRGYEHMQMLRDLINDPDTYNNLHGKA